MTLRADFVRAVARVGVAALACGIVVAQSSPTEIGKLVDQLGDADARTRMAAYQTLVREKPDAALALLADRVAAFPLDGQNLAFSLLQSYPFDKSLPFLRKLTRADAPFVRVAAATSLVRNGETAAIAVVVETIAAPGVATAARTMMLARVPGIADPALADAVRGLVTADAEGTVLDGALWFLLNAADTATPPKVRTLLAQSGLTDPSRGACAAYLLATGDTTQSLAVADAIRAGGASQVQRFSRFLTRASKLGDDVLGALVAVLERDPIQGYLPSLLVLLGTHGGARELAAVRKLLAHEEPYVARAAFDAVAKLTGGMPPKDLAGLLTSDQPELVLVAADALRRMDDHSGFARVVALVGKPGAHRAEAVRVLGRTRTPDAIAPVVGALGDDDADVRRAARDALAMLLSSAFPYRRFDIATTGYDPDAAPSVRAAGIEKIRAWLAAHPLR
jgi:hypothetical protein